MPPPGVNLETPAILKALALAHRHLAELKGCAKSIPNQVILINTLALQEAKASSEIESYVTTQDELFQADLQRCRPQRKRWPDTARRWPWALHR